MKKIGYLKNVFRSVSILVFCLCVLSATQAFGQRECSVVRGGSGNISNGGGITVGGVSGTGTRVFVETPNCKAVIGSLRSAGLLIYGVELKPNVKSDDDTLFSWLDEIRQKPIWNKKFNEGFTAADGMNFLKERFTTIGDGWLETFISTITDQIYGRILTRAERDFYIPRLKEQKETYASIFLAEKNKLNKNAAERKAMINRAYQKTMGKDATAAELQYWQPRSEIFREMIDTTRAYLYSPSGANDLKATVTRAYQTKYKNSPLVDSRIAKLTADYSKSKLIYVEMIKN